MLPLVKHRALRLLARFALVLTAGCGTKAVCKLGGPINSPEQRTLRRDLLKQGLGEFCKEMTQRSAPLRMSDDSPAIGRFFPRRCQQRELDSGNLWVSFEGDGYAWTNLSKKVTFQSAGTVEYSQDFRCSDDSSIYAYFPPRGPVQKSTFNVLQIEQKVAQLLSNWTVPFAENFGRQMLSGKLAEGFTVIRDTDDNTDFGMGLIPVGKRPSHPFNAHGSERTIYENQRVEIHQNERDFVGPIVIPDSNRAIFVQANVTGIDAVDLLLYSREVAEPALRTFIDQGAAEAIVGQPRSSAVVQTGAPFRQMIPVPAGVYYVVLDNTPSAGVVAPPGNLLDDRAAVIEYLIQIGDTP